MFLRVPGSNAEECEYWVTCGLDCTATSVSDGNSVSFEGSEETLFNNTPFKKGHANALVGGAPMNGSDGALLDIKTTRKVPQQAQFNRAAKKYPDGFLLSNRGTKTCPDDAQSTNNPTKVEDLSHPVIGRQHSSVSTSTTALATKSGKLTKQA